ncbi:hypothetical protein A0H81_11346 [Grifola frondosa]|uniref:Uncharacterized protein n=1 Tax=Grifola frondosa TaxID=5627 RepID=A0A1C7LVI4_GRIFR|nr:hypothetical protein A0H81_11346 [Grifola frondosa]
MNPPSFALFVLDSPDHQYGKTKGKERDIDSASYTPPTAASSSSFAHFGEKYPASINGAGASSSSRTLTGGSTPPSLSRRPGNVNEMAGPRPSTDAITLTLAQRLNELATANSEGLLRAVIWALECWDDCDDEYRLLRQNLFERFASGSTVPTETPLVRMSGAAQSTADPRTSISSSHQRRPSSNFHVQSLRPPSVQSKKSFTSAVTGLLRRATSRRVASSNASESGQTDAMSVYSAVSTVAERNTLPRTLSKYSSEVSLPDSSRVSQTFTRRQTGNHTSSATDPGSRSSIRSRKRSGSTAPPSSFPGSVIGFDQSYTHLAISDIPSDDQVESVQDIRHQIEVVEAEGRRLLDAFNGLELSTLTRRQRRPPVIPPLPSHGSLNDGSWPNISSSGLDRRSLRAGQDSDAMSFKSSGSARTMLSVKRTPSIGGKMRTATSTATLVSQSNVVMRKGSFSSVSSRSRKAPALPTVAGHLGLASSSSVNLTRSTGHLPLATVEETEGKVPVLRGSRWTEVANASQSVPASPIDRKAKITAIKAATSVIEEEEIQSMEVELADIRRRRSEVTARYEGRLEYLRARLKGAELREKILRK